MGAAAVAQATQQQQDEPDTAPSPYSPVNLLLQLALTCVLSHVHRCLHHNPSLDTSHSVHPRLVLSYELACIATCVHVVVSVPPTVAALRAAQEEGRTEPTSLHAGELEPRVVQIPVPPTIAQVALPESAIVADLWEDVDASGIAEWRQSSPLATASSIADTGSSHGSGGTHRPASPSNSQRSASTLATTSHSPRASSTCPAYSTRCYHAAHTLNAARTPCIALSDASDQAQLLSTAHRAAHRLVCCRALDVVPRCRAYSTPLHTQLSSVLSETDEHLKATRAQLRATRAVLEARRRQRHIEAAWVPQPLPAPVFCIKFC